MLSSQMVNVLNRVLSESDIVTFHCAEQTFTYFV